MLKPIVVAGVALIAGCSACAQPAWSPSFEVASVKPAAPCCAPGQWREPKAGVDRIDFPNVTLRYCLVYSYGVKEYQVSGPAWLGELKYDIIAKGPEGTRHDQLPAIMQALLAQRFKLQARHETKEFSVYTLILGKDGPRLKETPVEPGAPEGARFGMSSTAAGTGRLEARNANMTALANTLGRLVGLPVIDKTGLTGRYDFDLEFSREDAGGMKMASPAGGTLPAAPEPTVSIFGSVQQFGLKLNAQKLPLDAIVVDRAEKVATEN